MYQGVVKNSGFPVFISTPSVIFDLQYLWQYLVKPDK